jgi:hypothetical protein
MMSTFNPISSSVKMEPHHEALFNRLSTAHPTQRSAWM